MWQDFKKVLYYTAKAVYYQQMGITVIVCIIGAIKGIYENS